MARNLKPKWKQNRREGYSLFGSEKWQKRPGLPGVHAVSRKKPSDFSLQFREKQKVKRMYGLLERQFARFFSLAAKAKSNTGIRFLQLLEMRLDNVVYRLGLAPTRSAARQLVNHGHIKVDDKSINIPSHIVKIGNSIQVKESDQKKEYIKVNVEQSKSLKVPGWLKKSTFGGEVLALPTRDMIDQGINERLIVEYYSK